LLDTGALGVAWRPARDADMPFQRALFEAARPDVAILAAWPADTRRAFLDQQFRFQSVHYAREYADADWLIVEKGEAPIGRLIVSRAREEWLLIDIALLPPWRGQGTGTGLLRCLMGAARTAGTPILRLTVDANNPAQRLYRRLGFAITDEGFPNIQMAWRPPIS
jgi:GNAT superfamily N-acetyltransferase